MTMQNLFAAYQLPTRSLTVGRDAEHFRVSGAARVDLRSLGPIRRVLRLLVERHRETPGQPLTISEIFAEAWPDDDGAIDTLGGRRGRVYTILSRLRRMGLSSVLERSEAGYHLAPTCVVITERSLETVTRLAS